MKFSSLINVHRLMITIQVEMKQKFYTTIPVTLLV